jgi:hypothetical protein
MRQFTMSEPKIENLRVLVTGFPSQMEQKMQQALLNVFYVFSTSVNGIVFGNTLEERNSVIVTAQPKIEPEFIIRDVAGRAVGFLIDHWIREFILGRVHSLSFGVPRIGVDLIIYEVDDLGENVVDSWLIQNAIPVDVKTHSVVSEVEGKPAKSEVVHSLKLRGFVARNAAVHEIAVKAVAMAKEHAENSRKEAPQNSTENSTEESVGGGVTSMQDNAIASAVQELATAEVVEPAAVATA